MTSAQHDPVPESAPAEPGLQKRLGLSDAVTAGLGAMIGPGVFAVLAAGAAVYALRT
ncbi:hypothetical protein [Actinomadura macrotermitis]|uniref:hypothetical protein n=1 Tax=Actinomadura macrotermitis TaxID=2585200 RepID=UPI001295CB0C|nr:hypothetical protein [Actinomadura macrotermitis]